MRVIRDRDGSLWEELPSDDAGMTSAIFRPLNPKYIVPIPLEYLQVEFGPLTEGIDA